MSSKKITIQGTIPAAFTTFYTLEASRPANYKARLISFIICNSSVAARQVSMYLVPAGGAPAQTNQVLALATIAANGYLSWNGELTFDTAGMTLRLLSSNAGDLCFNGTIEEYVEKLEDQ